MRLNGASFYFAFCDKNLHHRFLLENVIGDVLIDYF